LPVLIGAINDTKIWFGSYQLQAMTYADIANLSSQYPSGQIIWLETPAALEHIYSIFSIVLYPHNPPTSRDGPQNQTVLNAMRIVALCTTRAIWAPVRLQYTATNIQGSMTSPLQDTGDDESAVVPICIAWANATLPSGVLGFNNTSIVELVSPNPASVSCVDRDCNILQVFDKASVYESMIAGFIAAGMARSSSTSADLLSLSNWSDLNITRWDSLLNPIEDQKNPSNSGEEHDAFKIKMVFTIRALAYTMDGISIKLAVSVLILYSLAATYSMMYALIIGRSSSGLESTAEIITLALYHQVDTLNTTQNSGVTGTKTFKSSQIVFEEK
jgi:hypothetical protein